MAKAVKYGALTALICALALAGAGLTASGAAADPAHKHKPKAHPAPVARRVLPNDLDISNSASVGSENHYFSDTVSSSYTDLTDLSYRYGQAHPHFQSAEPFFRF